MRFSALRFIMIATVASVALAGCSGKKKPVGVDSNTAAGDIGGFGPGGVAGGAPGGFGNGTGGVPGQLFQDANGNLVDANGNRVDSFGNPIEGSALGPLAGGVGGAGTIDGGVYQPGGVVDGGAYQPGGNGVFLDGNGNFVDVNGNPVDANGNPIGAAGFQQGGTFVQGDPNGQGFGQQGGNFVTGPQAGSYNFAGDDGSPGYFAQRVGDRVLFQTDSSNIDAQSQEILRRQAAWFSRHPQYQITVEGHADERGTRDYNLALGARRADAVRGFLSAQGIDPNRIRTVSYGKERPVNPASTPNGWAVNRRAVSTLRGNAGF